MYRRGGRLVRVTIGEYPAWSLAKARAEASRLQLEAAAEASAKAEQAAAVAEPAAVLPGPQAIAPLPVAQPVGESAPLPDGPEEEDAAEVLTYGQLVKAYDEQHLSTIRSGKGVLASLSRDCMQPHWDKPAAALTRGDIQKHVDHLVRVGMPSAATNLLKALKALYNFAIDEEQVAENPCDRAKRRTRTTRRDRILTDAELVAVWRACESPKVPKPFGDVVAPDFDSGSQKRGRSAPTSRVGRQ